MSTMPAARKIRVVLCEDQPQMGETVPLRVLAQHGLLVQGRAIALQRRRDDVVGLHQGRHVAACTVRTRSIRARTSILSF